MDTAKRSGEDAAGPRRPRKARRTSKNVPTEMTPGSPRQYNLKIRLYRRPDQTRTITLDENSELTLKDFPKEIGKRFGFDGQVYVHHMYTAKGEDTRSKRCLKQTDDRLVDALKKVDQESDGHIIIFALHHQFHRGTTNDFGEEIEPEDDHVWYPHGSFKFGRYSAKDAVPLSRKPELTARLMDGIRQIRSQNESQEPETRVVPDSSVEDFAGRLVQKSGAASQWMNGTESDLVIALSRLFPSPSDRYSHEAQYLTRLEALLNDGDGIVPEICDRLPRSRDGKEGKELSPAQQASLCFMLEKENEREGGIMADEPGVGSTTQMIAHIVASHWYQTRVKQRDVKLPTLVLSSSKDNTVKRLQNELGTEWTVFQHGNTTQSCLSDYDIVKVLFDRNGMLFRPRKQGSVGKHILVCSYEDLKDSSIDNDKMLPSFERIYCDNGHAMRFCHVTTRGKSLLRLKARFTWIITGTPIVDSVFDVLGYMAFLNGVNLDSTLIALMAKCKPGTEDTELYKTSLQAATKKVASFLEDVTLRREHGSKMTLVSGEQVDVTAGLPSLEIHRKHLQMSDNEATLFSQLMLTGASDEEMKLAAEKAASQMKLRPDNIKGRLMTDPNDPARIRREEPNSIFDKAITMTIHPAFIHFGNRDFPLEQPWLHDQSLVGLLWEMRKANAGGIGDMPTPWAKEEEILHQFVFLSPIFRELACDIWDTIQESREDKRNQVIVHCQSPRVGEWASKLLAFLGIRHLSLTTFKEVQTGEYRYGEKVLDRAPYTQVLIVPFGLKMQQLEGIDFHHHCRTIIFLEQPHNVTQYLRAIGGIRRRGQTATQKIIQYSMPKSPGDIVEKVMAKKEAMTSLVYAGGLPAATGSGNSGVRTLQRLGDALTGSYLGRS